MASDELNRLAALLQERLDGRPLDGDGVSTESGGDGPLARPALLEERAAGRFPPEQVEGTSDADPDLAPAKGLALPPGATLAGALEAVLLVANESMTVGEVMKVLVGATRAEINAALRELRLRYASSPTGFDVVDVAGGVRLLSRPVYAPWVERLEKVRREERLSRAQLEVLAVIAYRQPLVRADVDSVRGADSGGALRGLMDKGLVKVVGRADQLGRPLLYGTTDRFLERFCLKSLKELPRPKADA